MTTITTRYFNRRRSMANALCLSGAAAGAFTIPLVLNLLLDKYGFRGTLPILGALILNVCISAALYRPLAVHVLIMRNVQQSSNECPPPATGHSHLIHLHKLKSKRKEGDVLEQEATGMGPVAEEDLEARGQRRLSLQETGLSMTQKPQSFKVWERQPRIILLLTRSPC